MSSHRPPRKRDSAAKRAASALEAKPAGEAASTDVVLDGAGLGGGANPAPHAALAPDDEGWTFAQAMNDLMARVDLERSKPTPTSKHQYKLDRMRAILAKLGNPQEAVRCVHIAGTKGKGSTCEMTATALEACGYTVGVYTSPHILDVRERIRINRKPIAPAEFGRVAKVVSKAAAAVHAKHGDATFFEALTAMGFLYFAEQAVDAAVIEVGLGGLLDCTNVITPEVAAVTTIGLDHTQILGETIEEIAIQKAGIFKAGVPALTVVQVPKAAAALKEAARSAGTTLQVVGEDIEFTYRFEWLAGAGLGGGAGPQARVSLTTERSVFEHIAVPLRGEYQAINCGLALAILDKLAERGFNCPPAKVAAGLALASLPGRFELGATSPRILLDGAHNPDSIRVLMKAIGAYLKYDSLVVVFGCAADKDVDAMVQGVAGAADKVIFTKAEGNARAAKPAELARKYTELSGRVAQTAQTAAEAIDLARRAVQRDDLICVTGSFYLVGDAKRTLAAEIKTLAKGGRKPAR